MAYILKDWQLFDCSSSEYIKTVTDKWIKTAEKYFSDL